ncbi:mucolipin, putative [Perkinsus marinus ATCC 50983]|uniref:Mucolipin, putative n=1 Tax=Perkinsus marinus (strain ATCC 50983 / TXsc) TaxID=423536 RepID=C5L9J8_PERM5|nr:mucolipin, putative [Perkinsus marinus ATCC 50983]EER06591.1 mucolipin, putative [Perkinsus marinus ATCC 50983]|eukprot:XP_002774775.1 mucolipin, putative [Perkinsus marinus ATCC 50983]
MLVCALASAAVNVLALGYRIKVIHTFLKDSSVQDKLTVMNLWLLFSLIGNIIQLVAVGYAFLVDRPDIYMRLNLFGVSAAIALIFKFLVGVFPVYLSFVVCAVCLFGFHSHWFVSLGDSSTALFSLLNGDQIHDTFTNLKDVSVLGSRVFLYSFLALFIYVVLNIFITIAEDAFFTVKFMQGGAGPITNIPRYGHQAPAVHFLHNNTEEITRMPKSLTSYRHRASDPLLRKLAALNEGGVMVSHDEASTVAGGDSPPNQYELQAQVALLMRQCLEMQDQVRKLSEALLSKGSSRV